jgi:hypothetical protein
MSTNYRTIAFYFSFFLLPSFALIFPPFGSPGVFSGALKLFCFHHLTVGDLFLSKYQPSNVYSKTFLEMLSVPFLYYYGNLKIDPHIPGAKIRIHV